MSFSNTKNRILILIVLIIIGIFAGVGYWYWQSTHFTVPGDAAISGTPGISSIPGSSGATEQYLKTQEVANREAAVSALQKGQSAMPTILRTTTADTSSFTQAAQQAAAGGGAGTGFAQACVNLKDKYPYCFTDITTQQQAQNLVQALSKVAESCGAGVPASVCQREIQRLVADNLLTSEQAKALLNAYGKSGQSDTAGGKALAALITDKGLSPSLASSIHEVCGADGSDAKCAQLLKQLVAGGQLTPSEASQLLSIFNHPPIANLAGATILGQLVANKKLTPTEAKAILESCAKDLPRTVCQDELNRLVAKGKLTPAQVNQLLSAFSKTATDSPGNLALAKLLTPNGPLTPREAQEIAAACKPGMPNSVCAGALKRLTTQGIITAAQASQLLQAYGKTTQDQTAGTKLLGQLVANGALTPESAESVNAACQPGPPPEQCSNALQALVLSGKLTPTDAQKLLSAYRFSAASLGGPTGQLGRLVADGHLSPSEAAALENACQSKTNRQQCLTLIKRLVAQDKLTPAEANRLLTAYGQPADADLSGIGALANAVNAGALTPEDAQEIDAACKQGISNASCTNLLRNLLAEGKLTPELADKFLESYGRVVPPDLNSAGKVGQLIRAGILNDADAKLLEAACVGGTPTEACAQALERLVNAGKLTPEQANRLLASYGKSDPAGLLGQTSIQPALGASSIPSAAGLGTSNNENQRLQALLAQQQQTIDAQNLKQQVDSLLGTMSSQAAALFASWNPPPLQETVLADPAAVDHSNTSTKEVSELSGAAGKHRKQYVAIKAGDVQYAVLTTAVDSDEPGTPLMANVVQGPFRGSKVIGKFTRENKRVIIRFTLLNSPTLDHTVPIDAVAIDPMTAQTALATHVNSHYLVRYGSLFAATFLEGYGQAITNSGSSTTFSLNGITHTYPQTSPRQKVIIALGNTGSTLAEQWQPLFNMPPTVRVKAGIGIGLLFMSDVKVDVGSEHTRNQTNGG